MCLILEIIPSPHLMLNPIHAIPCLISQRNVFSRDTNCFVLSNSFYLSQHHTLTTCWTKKLCMTCKAGDIIKRKSAHIFVLIPQSRDEFCIQSIFPREKISLMNSSRVSSRSGVREKSWRIFRGSDSNLIESVPKGRHPQMRPRIISWQFFKKCLEYLKFVNLDQPVCVGWSSLNFNNLWFASILFLNFSEFCCLHLR